MAEREGVVKFRAEHRQQPLDGAVQDVAVLAAALSAWRHPLRALGWIGRDPRRYGGFGFGNLSARLPASPDIPEAGALRRPFLVTGSQTGGVERLGLDGFALVEDWDLAGNRLWSRGPVAASSESLTHAALYEVSPRIGAVFHVHAPELWCHRGTPGIPVTRPEVGYGTPEMAAEVMRVWEEGRRRGTGGEPPSAGLLAMGGHEDGLLAWGPTADRAGGALLEALLGGGSGGE